MSANIPKRRNRSHGAVDNLPPATQRLILDLYTGKPIDGIPRSTLEEISGELKKLGYNIGRGQVWRWLSRQRDDLNSLRDMAAKAETLIRCFVPNGATIEASVLNIFQAFFMKALNSAEITDAPSFEEMACLAHALGDLQSSAAARDKWENEKNKRISEAVERLKGEIGEWLGRNTELTEHILNSIDQAAEAMKGNAA